METSSAEPISLAITSSTLINQYNLHEPLYTLHQGQRSYLYHCLGTRLIIHYTLQTNPSSLPIMDWWDRCTPPFDPSQATEIYRYPLLIRRSVVMPGKGHQPLVLVSLYDMARDIIMVLRSFTGILISIHQIPYDQIEGNQRFEWFAMSDNGFEAVIDQALQRVQWGGRYVLINNHMCVCVCVFECLLVRLNTLAIIC